MIRFAHISDLHLSPLPKPTFRELCSKRFSGYYNWKKRRENAYDRNIINLALEDIKEHNCQHLIISGDLVNIATPAEFLQAKEFLEQIDKKENISIVPGNHDAYVAGALKKFEQTFAPWMKSDYQTSSTSSFPYVHKRKNLAIIGISSSVAQPPFISAGYISQKQLRELAKLLDTLGEEKLFRVIVLHHPPLLYRTHWHSQLWNYRQLQKLLFTHGAELVLHGHTHYPSKGFIKGKYNNIPVIGVGALGQKLGFKQSPSSYNLFEVETSENLACCSFQNYQLTDDNNFQLANSQIFKWSNF